MGLLTYYQVMPAFLDFVFPFGNTADARDFFYGGFKHETRLTERERGLRVDQIGRSGIRLQMAYSMWAPAETHAFENWKWSVQPISIYHSFDLETGRMLWILIKGDPKAKDQVAAAIKSLHHPQLRELSSPDDCFATSLATHELLLDWACGNWIWYINFLEENVQEITGRTLNATINRNVVVAALRASTQTTATTPPKLKRSQTLATIGRVFTGKKIEPPILPVTEPPIDPQPRKLPAKLPPGMNVQHQQEKLDTDAFDIVDIQKIERVEERHNTSLLIVRTQICIMKGLLKHYETVLRSKDAPKDITGKLKSAFTKFETSVSGAISDLQLHQSRLETLARLLAERKTLVSAPRHSLTQDRCAS